ncbi:hypothetical protein FN846DRAFT_893271 [Sphaerosporella brunnea]|uniref:Uncharacterized protein n=1 Tax=Sphaerosporella brunnea TaxID=1250544 RepID=A0A5J5EMI8_9PEZI|nr:hypothetical protein FN846DRAFT_893271 [Sphaerosporella brunnea]
MTEESPLYSTSPFQYTRRLVLHLEANGGGRDAYHRRTDVCDRIATHLTSIPPCMHTPCDRTTLSRQLRARNVSERMISLILSTIYRYTRPGRLHYPHSEEEHLRRVWPRKCSRKQPLTWDMIKEKLVHMAYELDSYELFTLEDDSHWERIEGGDGKRWGLLVRGLRMKPGGWKGKWTEEKKETLEVWKPPTGRRRNERPLGRAMICGWKEHERRRQLQRKEER